MIVLSENHQVEGITFKCKHPWRTTYKNSTALNVDGWLFVEILQSFEDFQLFTVKQSVHSIRKLESVLNQVKQKDLDNYSTLQVNYMNVLITWY